jgi:hypothetical protein
MRTCFAVVEGAKIGQGTIGFALQLVNRYLSGIEIFRTGGKE